VSLLVVVVVVVDVDENSLIATELKVFICFFCEKRFNDKHSLTLHQDTCSLRAFLLDSLFKNLRVPPNYEVQEPEPSRSTKSSFLEYFNVVSVGRAEAVAQREHKEQIICDTIVIEDSDEDDGKIELHVSLTSPRKLIPSDVKKSKDASRIFPRSESKNAVVVNKGSSIVSSSHSSEKLLKIDVCSPLGQRLRDHVDVSSRIKYEPFADKDSRPANNNSVVPDVNINSLSFCVRDLPFNDRLRQQGEFRVTFRPSRQQCRSLYSHTYKFTGRQRKEFCRAFDCGLSVRARRLLRKMKPCRVIVSKLSPDVIKTYCSNTPASEVESDQGRLVLRINKPVGVSVTRCDYQVTGGTMVDASRCHVNPPQAFHCQVASDLHQSGGLSSSDCRSAVVTSDNGQCHFSTEMSATVTSAPLTAANENSDDVSQQSTEVNLSANDVESLDAEIEKSDSRSISSSQDCKCDSIEHADTLIDRRICVAAEKHNCPQLVAATLESSEVGLNSSASSNLMETSAELVDMDSRATAKTKTSIWSMAGDLPLPALSFLCNICGDVVDCERDARSLIYEHYSGHGITNIELMDETTSTGDQVVKLIELPVSKTNSSTSTDNQATMLPASKSMPVEDKTSPLDAEAASSSRAASAAPVAKKRRRVTWADEVQRQLVPSPVHREAAQQDTASKQRLTASHTQPTTAMLSHGSVASTLHTTNDAVIPPKSVPFPVQSSVVFITGNNLSSNVVPPNGKICSRPAVVRMPADTTSMVTATRCRDTDEAASRRARMFWSNSSLLELTGSGNHSTVDNKQPHSSRTPPVTTRSKRAVNDEALSRSQPAAAGDCHTNLYSQNSQRSSASVPPPGHMKNTVSPGKNCFMPKSSMMPQTGEVTLNSSRRCYQPKTNVICID